MKGGLGRDVAARQSAEFTNELYGGINWESMGRNRDLQNFGRMLILAPDWLESNVRLGSGLAKTMLDPKNPKGRKYAILARGAIGSYIAADVVNHALSGHHMWENAPGHALDIQAGKSGDKDRWVRPFGTAADFLRLPFDIAASAMGGDLGQGARVIKNRASIPAGVIGNILWNEDDFGRPITGRDVYGRSLPVKKQIGGIASELSDLVAPPYARSVIDYSTGRSNTEQAGVGAIELPLRYSQTRPSRHSGRTRQ
jgi:hypothetical protein